MAKLAAASQNLALLLLAGGCIRLATRRNLLRSRLCLLMMNSDLHGLPADAVIDSYDDRLDHRNRMRFFDDR